MFGLGIFDAIKIGAGAALGALVASGPVYLYGTHEGRQQAAVARLQADVKAYVKREGIDHEVDGMDRYRICLGLGRLPDDCEQLRRLAETATGE